MRKKLTLPAIVTILLNVPLLSQTDFEYNLTRHKGNKIVLLGNWKTADTGKWKRVIDSDGIYEHGFKALSQGSFKADGSNYLGVRNIQAFERWFRQIYGLIGGVKWAALDHGNKLIVFGANIPSPKEFEQVLEKNGIKTPLKRVREFLRENQDHLDAKADLLKEVRRRALQKMPPDTTEDLDTETDLRVWGVMAAETDNVFGGSWLGINIDFFKPDKSQPERRSNLMRDVFRKHISKLESAIRLEPTSDALWDIWLWMAKSQPDYKWDTFINSLDTFAFYRTMSPTAKACAWIVEKLRAEKDWFSVIKFAKMAKDFYGSPRTSLTTEWVPGSAPIMFFAASPETTLEGYPAKSAYAPHLEALLRLGDIEGANRVYDEMIRVYGKTNFDKYESNNALIAANAARSAGMEDIAKVWEQGELINKAPYMKPILNNSDSPCFFVFTSDNGDQNDHYFNFKKLSKKLSPNISVLQVDSDDSAIDTLGWKENDGNRWALIARDGLVLTQGTAIPEQDDIQSILNRFNFETPQSLLKKYLETNKDKPGLELIYAFGLIYENAMKAIKEQDGTLWGEAVGYLNRVLRDYPEIVVNMTLVARYTISIQNSTMKALSKPWLANVESLLERKPSSDTLWSQWFLWQAIEGADRSIDTFLDRIKLSPLSQAGTVPPAFVIDKYYQQCKKNGNWPKAIELLKTAWDREYARINAPDDEYFLKLLDINSLAFKVGLPLIEAYLHDNKYHEADEIFNAVLDSGGKFTDNLKILELAKALGQERLARDWEAKLK
ncbi:MAG: hypothetical protein LBB40_02995 [Holophagales bacterium]|jgi:tetratricopeptide (TPR) repeat protein|nr:hypothetical protein [Holophagales bacterium]